MHSCKSRGWLKPCKHHKRSFKTKGWGKGRKNLNPREANSALNVAAWLISFCEHALVWVHIFEGVSLNYLLWKCDFLYLKIDAFNTAFLTLTLFLPSGTGVLIRSLRQWLARCRMGQSSSGSTRRAAGRRDVQEAGEKAVVPLRWKISTSEFWEIWNFWRLQYIPLHLKKTLIFKKKTKNYTSVNKPFAKLHLSHHHWSIQLKSKVNTNTIDSVNL